MNSGGRRTEEEISRNGCLIKICVVSITREKEELKEGVRSRFFEGLLVKKQKERLDSVPQVEI